MKKLFTNDKFFLAVTIIGVFGILFNDAALWFAAPEKRGLLVMDVLTVLCTIILYTSYKKHSKNVMKCIMGALLMLVLLRPIDALTVGTGVDAPSAITLAFFTLFAAVLFIDHGIINSDHHSNAGFIRANQILSVLILISEVVIDVIAMAQFESSVVKVSYIMDAISFACVVAAIVCVESRLDAYRLDRENAGWTEEKGYPENYVHEYEKK